MIDNIKDVVLWLIASVGGIGFVIVACVSFCSNIIAKRLEEKYTLRINEELERYKASIDNKKYITKTKFDAEFALYQSLSKAYFDIVKAVNVMIPQGLVHVPADEKKRDEYDEKNYKEAVRCTVIAQDQLNSNAPFIPQDLFDAYEEIRRLCNRQISEFEDRWNVMLLIPEKEKKQLSHEAYARTGEINEKFAELNKKLRDYLDSLDVLEEK